LHTGRVRAHQPPLIAHR